MSEHNRIHLDDAGADWDLLSSKIRTLGPEPVSPFDVARLRSSVRRQLPRSRPVHAWARLAASVAAVVVGSASLYATLDTRHIAAGDPETTGTPVKALKMVAADEKTVIFQFEDAQRPHRIVKTDDPRQTAGEQVRIAKGRRFVDRNEPLRPGEVVFYRID